MPSTLLILSFSAFCYQTGTRNKLQNFNKTRPQRTWSFTGAADSPVPTGNSAGEVLFCPSDAKASRRNSSAALSSGIEVIALGGLVLPSGIDSLQVSNSKLGY
jgi:hypothetical protein